MLIKRLDPYWKMEVGNAVILPALMLFMAKGEMGWVSAMALLPMILLLIIGGIYWRAKVYQLKTGDYDIHSVLGRIAAIRKPVLVLTTLGSAVAVMGWIIPNITVSLADRICASIAAILAVLEYVNYYHRQLQHFDNVADFKRLLNGKGFRTSQMASDLRAHGF